MDQAYADIEDLDQSSDGKGIETALMKNESNDFALIDKDEDAILDFHENHTIKPDPTIKQKFYQKL